MKSIDALLIVVSVALSSGSQVILKHAMTSGSVQAVMKSGTIADIVLTIATSPKVIGGLGCFGLSAVVWLFVLSRVPLSLAYPFVALGIGATTVAGVMIFGEAMTWQATFGILLVMSGILMVGLAR